MAARVVQRVAQEEVFENFPLMHATGAKAAGQIASVVAGGVLLALMGAGRALTPRPARAESGRRLPVRAFPADKKRHSPGFLNWRKSSSTFATWSERCPWLQRADRPGELT